MQYLKDKQLMAIIIINDSNLSLGSSLQMQNYNNFFLKKIKKMHNHWVFGESHNDDVTSKVLSHRTSVEYE